MTDNVNENRRRITAGAVHHRDAGCAASDAASAAAMPSRMRALRVLMLVLCLALLFGVASLRRTYAATSYDVWIGGVRVTSDNCNKLSTNKWKYDPATSTLTLKDFKYSGNGTRYTVDAEYENYLNTSVLSKKPLNLVIEGTSEIKTSHVSDQDNAGIVVIGDLTISGSGSLKVSTAANTSGCETSGIYVENGNLTLKSGKVTSLGGAGCSSYGVQVNKDVDEETDYEEEEYEEEENWEEEEEEGDDDYRDSGVKILSECGEVIIQGGTLSATGGSLSYCEGDCECVSAGIYCRYFVNVYGGSVTAQGGTATKSSDCSYGIEGSVYIEGGKLTSKGNAADVTSAGICGSNSIAAGGTLSASGGRAEYSYGIFSGVGYDDEEDAEGEDEYSESDEFYGSEDNSQSDGGDSEFEDDNSDDDDEIEDFFIPSEYALLLDKNAVVTVSGQTSASDSLVEWSSDHHEEYYEYSLFIPVIELSANADGSGSSKLINPENAITMWTQNKYVHIRPAITPSTIEVEPESIVFDKECKRVELKATVEDGEYEYTDVKWYSEDTDVAKVDGNEACSYRKGETSIFAILGGTRVEIPVSVLRGTVIDSFVLSEGTLFFRSLDSSAQLEVKIEPEDMQDEDLVWGSFNSSVATVDENGLVTPVGNGKTQIVVYSEDTHEFDYCDVEVQLVTELSPDDFSLSSTSFEYTGEAIEPEVISEDLVEGIDYEVTYEDNHYPGTGRAVITGLGAIKGEVVLDFDINLSFEKYKYSGTCGSSLQWCITDRGELMIIGSSEMTDYSTNASTHAAPWNMYNETIKSIYIGDEVKSIGNHAFDGLKKPFGGKLTLGQKLRSIGDHAFDGTLNGEYSMTLELSRELEEIGKYAFADNRSITGKVNLPYSMEFLGEGAFERCTGIVSVNLESSIKDIRPYTFAYCSALKYVGLGEYNITNIESNAFRNCRALRYMRFPVSVRKLEKRAFAGCSILEEGIFACDAPQIEDDAFENCAEGLFFMFYPGKTGWTTPEYRGFKTYHYHMHDSDGYDIISKADFEQDGKISLKCSVCGMDRSSTREISRVQDVSLDKDVFTYNGTPQVPTVTVTATDGTKLVAGKNYIITTTNCVEAGTVTLTVELMGFYEGERSVEYEIQPAAIDSSRFKLSATSFAYTGKVRKPAVNAKGYASDDYKVTYLSPSSKNVGTYKLRISGADNYTGTVELAYKINPKGVSLKSLSAGRKLFKAGWVKGLQGISGYQLQYSTDSGFKTSPRTVTIKGRNNVSRKQNGLKARKRYYVRVRTYKTTGGRTYYSAWSKSRSVTTKK